MPYPCIRCSSEKKKKKKHKNSRRPPRLHYCIFFSLVFEDITTDIDNIVRLWVTLFHRHPFLDKCLSDSDLEGSSGDSNDYDKILVSIKDLEVTPENIREFLPKVNWEQLASMYVVGRSGAECEARYVLS